MKNVLIIDDETIFHFLGTRMLTMLGIQEDDIRSARNGRQALTLFKEFYCKASIYPDYILLDLNMPIMDGFGFLEAFGKLELPNKELIKIVVVSSSQNGDDINRALKLGAKEFISKPLREESLRHILQVA